MKTCLGTGLLGVLLALCVSGCVAPLDGNTSCADFLDSNLADREDIVDEAMNQRGVDHDDLMDLTIVSLQVNDACQKVGDKSTPVKNVINWGPQ